jgi:hypothetical protein
VCPGRLWTLFLRCTFPLQSHSKQQLF